MNDQPIESEPERRLSRRSFLRGTAVVASIGSTAGCLDDANGIPDVIDRSSDEIIDDEEPLDSNERVKRYEREIHEQITDVRRDHDLDELAYNEDIAAVARRHSVDMAERRYFAHESPEGEGPSDRMADFVPQHCRGIGENLAKVGYLTEEDAEAIAERIVTGWMNSPGHRENVLREAFDEQGIGVVFDDDSVLATQKFCSTSGGFV